MKIKIQAVRIFTIFCIIHRKCSEMYCKTYILPCLQAGNMYLVFIHFSFSRYYTLINRHLLSEWSYHLRPTTCQRPCIQVLLENQFPNTLAVFWVQAQRRSVGYPIILCDLTYIIDIFVTSSLHFRVETCNNKMASFRAILGVQAKTLENSQLLYAFCVSTEDFKLEPLHLSCLEF